MQLRSIFYGILLIGFSLLEVAITVLLAARFGVVKTFLFFFITGALGLAAQWFRWRSLNLKKKWGKYISLGRRYDFLPPEERQAAFNSDPEYAAVAKNLKEITIFGTSFILFFVPGFLTHLLAFALMLPRVQKILFSS